MDVMQATGLRFLFAAVILLILIRIFRCQIEIDFGTHVKLVFLSLVLAARFIAFAVGSNSLPMAEFSLLANTVPIYTTAFGCVFLRERSLKKALACAMATAGVITVCLPSFAGNGVISFEQQSRKVIGYSSTLISALANAVALIWLRNLGSISAMWVSLYASVATFLMAAIGAASTENPVVPSISDLGYVALAGMCSVMQLHLPAMACVLTDSSRVAISMTSTVLFSFILQATVQRSAPSSLTYAGAVLVVLAMVLSTFKRSFFRTDGDDEKNALIKTEQPNHNWQRYGTETAIGEPERSRLCKACRLAQQLVIIHRF
ncbi:solute carrier family 35 member G1 [Galendromus occidentalis]|uniref:Solute carrier family 35 member G1 n=1 Tax=Galendromus occidentalis TaxID=34638 RepID=A0AAJ6VYM0_9ACAR|nr:solute carrier family 35 member G1 [Galendromus occidentalis]